MDLIERRLKVWDGLGFRVGQGRFASRFILGITRSMRGVLGVTSLLNHVPLTDQVRFIRV